MRDKKLPRELRGKKLTDDQMKRYYPERFCPACGSSCCSAYHMMVYGGGGSSNNNKNNSFRGRMASFAGSPMAAALAIIVAASVGLAIKMHHEGTMNREQIESYMKGQIQDKAIEKGTEMITGQNELETDVESQVAKTESDAIESLVGGAIGATRSLELASQEPIEVIPEPESLPTIDIQVPKAQLALNKLIRESGEPGQWQESDTAKDATREEMATLTRKRVSPPIRRMVEIALASVAKPNGTPVPAGRYPRSGYALPTGGSAGSVAGKVDDPNPPTDLLRTDEDDEITAEQRGLFGPISNPPDDDPRNSSETGGSVSWKQKAAGILLTLFMGTFIVNLLDQSKEVKSDGI